MTPTLPPAGANKVVSSSIGLRTTVQLVDACDPSPGLRAEILEPPRVQWRLGSAICRVAEGSLVR